MSYRKRTKVRTGAYGACIGFCGMATTVLTVAFGPIGLLIGGAALAGGLSAARNDAKRGISKVLTDEDEKRLISAVNREHFNSKMIYHGGAGNNPLMSAIFGNDISVKTTYFRK